MNNVFNVNVNIEVPEVICQFLNGPVASATCTIVYGTDPLNLPNNDTSTGTNVTKVTIPLGVSLHRDTLYYYVVSTIGVQMQGTFRIGIIMCASFEQYLYVCVCTDAHIQLQFICGSSCIAFLHATYKVRHFRHPDPVHVDTGLL